ncbi:MAG TPA: hypothetical protein PK082_07050 [Phycisphaerae bacterium]|nr:hypothetical protein [Phycisphaerae bacterium]
MKSIAPQNRFKVANSPLLTLAVTMHPLHAANACAEPSCDSIHPNHPSWRTSSIFRSPDWLMAAIICGLAYAWAAAWCAAISIGEFVMEIRTVTLSAARV